MKKVIRVSQGVLDEEELTQVKEAFDYGYFGMSKKVYEFEKKLSDYLGVSDSVATHTGTSALHLAVDSLEIGEDDEVILPSLTFVGCFQAIAATGATPVPCEVDEKSLLMDLDHVESLINHRTKAIMPVHYAGNPCQMDRLLTIKKEKGVRIIEDAAHALGSTDRGRKIGSFGDITCFSFDSIKNITCGEGGALISSDPAVLAKARIKRLLGIQKEGGLSEGKRWQYAVTDLGYRYHMSNINAAIGIAQLDKLESFVSRRREIARLYDKAFSHSSFVKSLPINYNHVAPHIYVIRIKDGRRDALMDHLTSEEIETTLNYIPCHLHPYFRKPETDLPVTEKIYGEILTLPLHCRLTNEDVERVTETVLAFFAKQS